MRAANTTGPTHINTMETTVRSLRLESRPTVATAKHSNASRFSTKNVIVTQRHAAGPGGG
jgi:hypothetical protein